MSNYKNVLEVANSIGFKDVEQRRAAVKNYLSALKKEEAVEELNKRYFYHFDEKRKPIYDPVDPSDDNNGVNVVTPIEDAIKSSDSGILEIYLQYGADLEKKYLNELGKLVLGLNPGINQVWAPRAGDETIDRLAMNGFEFFWQRAMYSNDSGIIEVFIKYANEKKQDIPLSERISAQDIITASKEISNGSRLRGGKGYITLLRHASLKSATREDFLSMAKNMAWQAHVRGGDFMEALPLLADKSPRYRNEVVAEIIREFGNSLDYHEDVVLNLDKIKEKLSYFGKLQELLPDFKEPIVQKELELRNKYLNELDIKIQKLIDIRRELEVIGITTWVDRSCNLAPSDKPPPPPRD